MNPDDIATPLLNAVGQLAMTAITDAKGQIVYVNDTFVTISHYSRRELIGKNLRILKSGYHPASFYKKLWRTISRGKVWRDEINNKAKDGTHYWVDASIAPVMGSGHVPKQYVAVYYLISDKKKLEQTVRQLRNEKKRMAGAKAQDSSLLTSIGDGVVATDALGKIIFLNQAAHKLLGLPPRSVAGELFQRVVKVFDEGGHELPLSERPLTKSLTAGESVTNATAYSYARSDGTRFPVAITTTPIKRGTKIVGFVEVFRDITKEKYMDRSKTEFIAIASHQLRTPLTTIAWYTEHLSRHVSTSVQKKYVAQLDKSTAAMIRLVNDLLNVSRLELGRFDLSRRPVFLKRIFEEMILILKRPLVAKHLHLTFTCRGAARRRQLPDQAIRVIVLNVLDNAVRYTPAHGHVRVTAACAHHLLTFTVKDDGPGIPPEELPRIFDKMFRGGSVSTTEGTGLGLYIVKLLIDALQGSISVTSKKGGGTLVSVRLPLMRPSS